MLLFFKICASDVLEDNKYSVNEFNILDFQSLDDDKRNFPRKYFKVYLWSREHTSGMCSHPAIPRLFLFLEKNSSEYQIAKKVAKEFKEKTFFVKVDLDNDEQKEYLKTHFDIKDVQAPDVRQVKLIDFTENYSHYRVFKPDFESFSEEALVKFVQEAREGKMKWSPISAKIPSNWNSTLIKTLVHDNFNTFIENSDKDVIVKFHWKNNHDEQDWIDLTKKFQNVTFAEMDISENDVPGFQYPMSKFKVFKKTRLQEFETNSIQELKAFLQESNEELLHVDL